MSGTGPGRFSLDRAIGWDDNLSGAWWIAIVAVGVAVTGFVTLNRRAPARAPADGNRIAHQMQDRGGNAGFPRGDRGAQI